jgi:hypothetical protein
MTFDELWDTLPIPFGYEHMDDLDKARWKAMVEAAFRTGLFEGAHKSASAKTADSKRISALEVAVAEIRAEVDALPRSPFMPIIFDIDAKMIAIKKDLEDAERHHKDVCAIHAQDLRERDARISQLCESERRLKAELRNISNALDDPRVDLTMTASEVIKGLRSALKVIHTWASFPESFDLEQTKRLCMSALGRDQ